MGFGVDAPSTTPRSLFSLWVLFLIILSSLAPLQPHRPLFCSLRRIKAFPDLSLCPLQFFPPGIQFSLPGLPVAHTYPVSLCLKGTVLKWQLWAQTWCSLLNLFLAYQPTPLPCRDSILSFISLLFILISLIYPRSFGGGMGSDMLLVLTPVFVEWVSGWNPFTNLNLIGSHSISKTHKIM